MGLDDLRKRRLVRRVADRDGISRKLARRRLRRKRKI